MFLYISLFYIVLKNRFDNMCCHFRKQMDANSILEKIEQVREIKLKAEQNKSEFGISQMEKTRNAWIRIMELKDRISLKQKEEYDSNEELNEQPPLKS